MLILHKTHVCYTWDARMRYHLLQVRDALRCIWEVYVTMMQGEEI